MTRKYGKSNQFLEVEVKLTINNFPYYQEWDHWFPLQRKKPLLSHFLPRISMAPIHTHPTHIMFPFPLEI